MNDLPKAYVEKERAKILWSRELWQQLQNKSNPSLLDVPEPEYSPQQFLPLERRADKASDLTNTKSQSQTADKTNSLNLKSELAELQKQIEWTNRTNKRNQQQIADLKSDLAERQTHYNRVITERNRLQEQIQKLSQEFFVLDAKHSKRRGDNSLSIFLVVLFLVFSFGLSVRSKYWFLSVVGYQWFNIYFNMTLGWFYGFFVCWLIWCFLSYLIFYRRDL